MKQHNGKQPDPDHGGASVDGAGRKGRKPAPTKRHQGAGSVDGGSRVEDFSGYAEQRGPVVDEAGWGEANASVDPADASNLRASLGERVGTPTERNRRTKTSVRRPPGKPRPAQAATTGRQQGHESFHQEPPNEGAHTEAGKPRTPGTDR